jgi:NAD(P)H-flavin reductase
MPLKDDDLGIEVVCKVIGTETRVMKRLKRGDTVDIIGPLGHEFELNREKTVQVVAAGGNGGRIPLPACRGNIEEGVAPAGTPMEDVYKTALPFIGL